VYDDYRAHDDYSNDNDDLDNNLDDILGRLQFHHDECYGHNNDDHYDDNDNNGDVFVDDIPRVEIRRAETHYVDGNGHGTALGRTRINNEANHGIQNHLRHNGGYVFNNQLNYDNFDDHFNDDDNDHNHCGSDNGGKCL